MKRLLLSLLAVSLFSAGLFAQDAKNLPVLKGNVLTYNGQSVELSGKMTEQQFAEEAAKEAAARAAENTGDEADAEELERAVSAPVEGSVYDSVEEQPVFKGGDSFAHWVASHLRYPAKAKEDGISGRVTVRFVVTDKGTVRQVKVMRGVEDSLDKEAVRVIASSSGKWYPGVKDGKRVNTRLLIPVVFNL